MFRLLDDNTKEVQCASCLEAEHRLYKVPCGHSYCRECVRGMFVAALNDSTLMPVKCCGRRVDQRLRRVVLNLEECDRFEAALEESEATNKMFWYVSKHNISFHRSRYFTHHTLFLDHSPRPDCSTFHNLDKTAHSGTGRFLCSNCNLPLCANCRSTHANMTCAAYQSLPEQDRSMNDILFLNAAKKARYAQCPWCSRFIERRDGCDSMRCRCGFAFGYAAQVYQGPKDITTGLSVVSKWKELWAHLTGSTVTAPAPAVSAYVREESPCAHKWARYNTTLSGALLCHLCRRHKRCYQIECSECYMRACPSCAKDQVK